MHQLLRRYSLPTSSSKRNSGNEGSLEAKREILARVKETSPRMKYRETKKSYKPRFTRIPIDKALRAEKPKGSPKVLEEYKNYVVSLDPNEAGRFTVANDKEGQMLRTRIKRAAAALGLDVKVRKFHNEILFWYENNT